MIWNSFFIWYSIFIIRSSELVLCNFVFNFGWVSVLQIYWWFVLLSATWDAFFHAFHPKVKQTVRLASLWWEEIWEKEWKENWSINYHRNILTLIKWPSFWYFLKIDTLYSCFHKLRLIQNIWIDHAILLEWSDWHTFSAYLLDYESKQRSE